MSKDFEQQAKKLGDDFSLQPREPVWMRIEAALDEKKRRGVAWWIWAFPLALLLGSGLGYYFYSPANTTPIVTTSETENSKTTIANTKEATPNVDKPSKPSSTSSPTQKNSPDAQTTNGTVAAEKKQPFRGLDQHQSPTHAIAHTSSDPKNNSIGNESNQPDEKTIVPAPVPTTPVSSSTGSPGTPQAIAGTGELQSSVAFSSQATSPVDSSGNHLPEVAGVASSVAVTEAVPASASKEGEATEAIEATTKIELPDSNLATATSKKSGVKPVVPKKATWFVQAGIGKAQMGEFDVFPGSEKAFASDPLQSTIGPGAVITEPKSDEAGVAYSIALQRRQALGNRWQWQASVGWQHQQVKQYLGSKVDSTIVLDPSRSLTNSFYYRPGSNSSVKGTNNRLILSNDFSWQVLRNQPWLRISGGLYTGVNISNDYYVPTNAQRMVKNDGLYTHWFLGFTPGIEFSYKNKLTLGAYSHFDFTRAYDELNSTPQYWRGWEIKAGISIFNK